MDPKVGKTVKACLATVGIHDPVSSLSGCATLEEEFSKVKRRYFKKILKAHPDKGGDPAEFRDIQATFEVLRELFDTRAVDSFITAAKQSTAAAYVGKASSFAAQDVPSWDYYAAAAEEPVPAYRVETAKSGRSHCRAQGTAKGCQHNLSTIPKGEIRIGSLDLESGSYGKWVHLCCWRVPAKVWLGLPEPDKCGDPRQFEAALLGMNSMIFCGLSELSKHSQRQVTMYAMNKKNWARVTEKKRKEYEEDLAARATKVAKTTSTATARKTAKGSKASKAARCNVGSASATAIATPLADAGAIVPTARAGGGGRLVVPVPGRGGAVANSLVDETFVLTGIFPELGGGAGLELGKERARAMIERFGGRVTSAVSGKTTVLLVGQEPGFSKVSQAREKGVRLMTLDDLCGGLHSGGLPAPDALTHHSVTIANFSHGYRGNSLAYLANPAALAYASGHTKYVQ
ncbi:hypothetical protein CYMTET_22847 [Cymbomonas tetramitiformis]|uniref:BRCT domain-containing protein n=1 Tax=Cymbomonas tetramitiformis TaxID=36881 RepID=A0AAE0FZL2_9CHLO|nr:hypothetical protein CYMTET_22847 [Cymbomonas tetramitiformis]|eukprot:gene23007-27834_t